MMLCRIYEQAQINKRTNHSLKSCWKAAPSNTHCLFVACGGAAVRGACVFVSSAVGML
jgi:hypothetical protein